MAKEPNRTRCWELIPSLPAGRKEIRRQSREADPGGSPWARILWGFLSHPSEGWRDLNTLKLSGAAAQGHETLEAECRE